MKFLCILLLCAVATSAFLHPHQQKSVFNKKLVQKLQQQQEPGMCQNYPDLVPLPINGLEDLIAAYDAGIQQILLNSSYTASMTVNLIYDQTVLWTKGYGLKDITDPTSVPNGDTGYRIGSNSKVFTTLLALIAQEQGLLSFEDPVSKYIPGFTPMNPFPLPNQKPITIAHLASHMAGLPRESPCMMGNCSYSNAEMWPKFDDVMLVSPPGVYPSYSNAGFAILGHVVEEVFGGTDWRALLQKYIINPLNLTFTGAVFTPEVIANMAQGYMNETVDPIEFFDIGWEGPAGQLYSTTNDLAKLMMLFFRDEAPINNTPDQILDGTTIRDWRKPNFINTDGSGFGMPWEIYSSPNYFTKGGSIPGYLSNFIAAPELKFGSVILQSSGTSPAYEATMEFFAATIAPQFAEILAENEVAPVLPANVQNLLGTYPFSVFEQPLNVTITMGPVPMSKYPQLIANDYLVLKYVAPNTYLSGFHGLSLPCELMQSGIIQYFFFDDSTNPPTLTIPGIFPAEIAARSA